MTKILNSIKPQIAMPLFGFIGGILLILIAGKEQNAVAVIPIFGLTLILTTLTIKISRQTKNFFDLFVFAFLTFAIMFAIDFVYLINIVNPSLLNMSLFAHVWRLAFILIIGAVVSAVLSYVSSVIKNRFISRYT